MAQQGKHRNYIIPETSELLDFPLRYQRTIFRNTAFLLPDKLCERQST